MGRSCGCSFGIADRYELSVVELPNLSHQFRNLLGGFIGRLPSFTKDAATLYFVCNFFFASSSNRTNPAQTTTTANRSKSVTCLWIKPLSDWMFTRSPFQSQTCLSTRAAGRLFTERKVEKKEGCYE